MYAWRRHPNCYALRARCRRQTQQPSFPADYTDSTELESATWRSVAHDGRSAVTRDGHSFRHPQSSRRNDALIAARNCRTLAGRPRWQASLSNGVKIQLRRPGEAAGGGRTALASLVLIVARPQLGPLLLRRLTP